MFSTGPSGGSPETKRVTAKPRPVSASSRTERLPASFGVTLGQAMRREASSIGSIARVMADRLARQRRLAQRRPEMPTPDLDSIEQRSGSTYPQPFAADMAKRRTRRFGPAVGFTDFGVAQVTLEPGGISSQRHWHEDEDEFVVMIEGEATLVEEDGETLLRPGDCASFLKGVANGHHLVNRSDA